jgi:undecaprenyl-diphosphatase
MVSLRRLTSLDRDLSARLALTREARLSRVLALVLAHSGDSPLWLAGATAALIWGDAVWHDLGTRVLAGTLAAGGTATVLKWLFRRQRPPGEGRGFYTRFDRHAFPSGHAVRSACLAILLTPFLPAWGSGLLASWVGLVGLARVALQVHYASDIVGGWAVGMMIGLVLRTAY